MYRSRSMMFTSQRLEFNWLFIAQPSISETFIHANLVGIHLVRGWASSSAMRRAAEMCSQAALCRGIGLGWSCFGAVGRATYYFSIEDDWQCSLAYHNWNTVDEPVPTDWEKLWTARLLSVLLQQRRYELLWMNMFWWNGRAWNALTVEMFLCCGESWRNLNMASCDGESLECFDFDKTCFDAVGRANII